MIRFLFLSSKFFVSQNTKHKQIANRESHIANRGRMGCKWHSYERTYRSNWTYSN